MNDNFFSEKSLRPRSALEVAITARDTEKKMALMSAEIGIEAARGHKPAGGSLKHALTSLLGFIVK